jgi:hypothetical protein
MSSHHQARATFFAGSRRAPDINILIVVSLAIVLQGCAVRPAIPFAGADPADAAAPIAATRVRAAGFVANERPSNAAPWTKTSASASESAR